MSDLPPLVPDHSPDALRAVAARTEAAGRNLCAIQPTETLIATWQRTDTMSMSPAVARLRGWILDALHDRGDDGLVLILEGMCPVCAGPLERCDCGDDWT